MQVCPRKYTWKLYLRKGNNEININNLRWTFSFAPNCISGISQVKLNSICDESWAATLHWELTAHATSVPWRVGPLSSISFHHQKKSFHWSTSFKKIKFKPICAYSLNHRAQRCQKYKARPFRFSIQNAEYTLQLPSEKPFTISSHKPNVKQRKSAIMHEVSTSHMIKMTLIINPSLLN